jgi:chorismate-pyruvate lyase
MSTLPLTLPTLRPPSEAYPLPPAFTLDDLYDLFPDRGDKPTVEPVPADEVPQPYHRLLVHTHHMTVTVEGFYVRPVDVKVLEARRDGDSYARKILLALRPDGDVVQFGLVQIDLAVLDPAVRDQILAQKTPLGRVLIQNDVLRTVRPVSFFRAIPSPAMCNWFGLSRPEPTYGRLGVIYTNHKPAIKVVEILAPVGAA